MPIADIGTSTNDEARRAAQRRLAQLQADNTPESLNAATSTVAAAASPRPSLTGQPTVLDQSQRASERSRFTPSASQLEQMQASIADTAARNRDLATGAAGARPTSGTPGQYQPDLGRAIRSRLGVPDRSNPLGVGATPASLGAGPASASVQRATGTAPNSLETQRQLGSAPLSSEGQSALGVAPNSLEVQSALGAAPVGQQKAPTSLPGLRGTTAPTHIDQAQRAGERSSLPAYDMDALKAEAARRAADANAANGTNSGTTTTTPPTGTGSTIPQRPPQPPTQPPTTEIKPPTTPPDDTSISDAFTKMFQGQGDQFIDAPGDGAVTGATAGAGAGGTGLIDQSGTGSAGTTAQLQQALASDINEISSILAAGANAPDVQSIFAAQGRTVLDMIDQQIREMQAEGEGVDPATQNMLAVMREELDRQLKQTREALNRRGILESGIAIEAEQILRRGNMSDQAMILAERLSRIQQNIQSLRGQKATEASRFGFAGAQAQTQAELAERNRMDDLRGLRQQGRTTLLNNQTDIEESQRGRDFQAEQNQLQRQSVMAQKMADLAVQANDKAAERQWEERKLQLEQQFKASQEAQRAPSGGTARASTTPRATTRAAGSNASDPGENTWAAIADINSKYDVAEEAIADISANEDHFTSQGVDLSRLYDAASQLPYKTRAARDRRS
jgi:hypothetical protein